MGNIIRELLKIDAAIAALVQQLADWLERHTGKNSVYLVRVLYLVLTSLGLVLLLNRITGRLANPALQAVLTIAFAFIIVRALAYLKRRTIIKVVYGPGDGALPSDTPIGLARVLMLLLGSAITGLQWTLYAFGILPNSLAPPLLNDFSWATTVIFYALTFLLYLAFCAPPLRQVEVRWESAEQKSV